jgi:hypothetical protein
LATTATGIGKCGAVDVMAQASQSGAERRNGMRRPWARASDQARQFGMRELPQPAE